MFSCSNAMSRSHLWQAGINQAQALPVVQVRQSKGGHAANHSQWKTRRTKKLLGETVEETPAYAETGYALTLGQAVYDRRPTLGLSQTELARRRHQPGRRTREPHGVRAEGGSSSTVLYEVLGETSTGYAHSATAPSASWRSRNHSASPAITSSSSAPLSLQIRHPPPGPPSLRRLRLLALGRRMGRRRPRPCPREQAFVLRHRP